MIVELFGSQAPSELHMAIEKIIADLQADTSTQKIALYLSQKLEDLKQLLVHFITAQYAMQDTREVSEQIKAVSEAMGREIQTFTSVRTALQELQEHPSDWDEKTLSLLEEYKRILTQRSFLA
jgi:cell fate (sporulation/competence/biofilm development) regulator YlbF (YheA/YmcA/DUF963 family)